MLGPVRLFKERDFFFVVRLRFRVAALNAINVCQPVENTHAPFMRRPPAYGLKQGKRTQITGLCRRVAVLCAMGLRQAEQGRCQTRIGRRRIGAAKGLRLFHRGAIHLNRNRVVAPFRGLGRRVHVIAPTAFVGADSARISGQSNQYHPTQRCNNTQPASYRSTTCHSLYRLVAALGVMEPSFSSSG